MDTEAIIDIVEAAFGSDSPIAGWIDSYKGQLVDSLRKYLNNINSVIHVDLYNKDGEKSVLISFVSMLLRAMNGMRLSFQTELILPINLPCLLP